ncbi:6364_t:CDS:2 [Paraglomus brasilianum]|uniref:6364_t:CDS:1 n=1 Tax=Paraglomus brasilianum TaxID=144538 RepID=A0A9N9GVJ2_9GLOM|nr:6364_t:CDS:2 [Paraglomus brasilianum]
MGKNCGYSSSEGLFAVDSLTEDSITTERSEELLVNPQLLKLWLTLSCQELYCERLQHPGQVFLSKIALPYTSGQVRAGQKLRLFSRRAPVVTCRIEGDALTDHSEELLLPHQP